MKILFVEVPTKSLLAPQNKILIVLGIFCRYLVDHEWMDMSNHVIKEIGIKCRHAMHVSR